MRLFAIKDDSLENNKVLGYLIYYENSKSFYIELPDGADRWETPIILSSFAERGIYTIDCNWSKRWIQQRIIPQDRQNIGQILRDNNLKEYDEFALLMLTMGHCEQDDCYLEENSVDPLPDLLIGRWKTKIKDIVPMGMPRLLVFFRNGISKVIDLSEFDNESIVPFLTSQERFNTVEVQPDGYGICWSSSAMLSHKELYSRGVTIPLSLDDLNRYVQYRVVSASEACSILDCSRQNIDDLMHRDKLHPIRTDAKYKLFSKAEVMDRKRL